MCTCMHMRMLLCEVLYMCICMYMRMNIPAPRRPREEGQVLREVIDVGRGDDNGYLLLGDLGER